MSRVWSALLVFSARLLAAQQRLHDGWVNRGAFKNSAGEWCCGDYDCKSYAHIIDGERLDDRW
jgi:hypothetical protein